MAFVNTFEMWGDPIEVESAEAMACLLCDMFPELYRKHGDAVRVSAGQPGSLEEMDWQEGINAIENEDGSVPWGVFVEHVGSALLNVCDFVTWVKVTSQEW